MAADLVKSAARAFEIVEVFANERRRMTAAELGAFLPYPKSSLNVLLKSLVAQGYLSFHASDLSYFPTLRLTQLGDWIPPALFGSNALLENLETLRDRTNETVTLTMPAGLQMRVLRVLLGRHPIALQLSEGYLFPIFTTGVGLAYLSTLPEEAVQALIKRAAEQKLPSGPPSARAILAEVAEVRSRGFAAAYDRVLADTGAIAMPIVSPELGETLVVAVAGLGKRIKESEPAIVRHLKRWTRHVLTETGEITRDTSAA